MDKREKNYFQKPKLLDNPFKKLNFQNKYKRQAHSSRSFVTSKRFFLGLRLE